MTQLRLTLQAEQDLLEAWLYIAEENPTAADRIVDAIYQSARQLAESPLLGRDRAELGTGLRGRSRRHAQLVAATQADAG